MSSAYKAPSADAVADHCAELFEDLDSAQAILGGLQQAGAAGNDERHEQLVCELESRLIKLESTVDAFRDKFSADSAPCRMGKLAREVALDEAYRLLDRRNAPRRAPLVVQTSRGPRAALASLELPGVICVRLRSTGELIAQSLPGSPTRLAWPPA